MIRSLAFILSAAILPSTTLAADWPQFRGADGAGIRADATIPLEWGSRKNIAWKADLPGGGSSSPIIVGDRVFVTCFTGAGEGSRQSSLKRHLVCLDRKTGKTLWSKSVDAVLPEDPYRGYLTEHGYASSTPASDGKSVYVFFGKSGVLAFDLAGKQLWRTSVGKESDNRGWGSGASPVLFKNLVIVNAASESRAVRALDKTTGQEVWKAEASRLDLSFGTPTLVTSKQGRTELILCVPGEVWALNPETGKLFWFASVRIEGNVSPSAVAGDGIVYVTGGFQGRGTVAIRTGGKGDVTGSHVLWSIRESSYVPSPILQDGKLYWVSEMGSALCVDAATGKTIYQEKLPLRGERGGKPVYASLVLAQDRLIAVTRTSGTFVYATGPKFKVLARNSLEDTSDFNATPALADGQLVLRSNRSVYLLADQAKVHARAGNR